MLGFIFGMALGIIGRHYWQDFSVAFAQEYRKVRGGDRMPHADGSHSPPIIATTTMNANTIVKYITLSDVENKPIVIGVNARRYGDELAHRLNPDHIVTTFRRHDNVIELSNPWQTDIDVVVHRERGMPPPTYEAMAALQSTPLYFGSSLSFDEERVREAVEHALNHGISCGLAHYDKRIRYHVRPTNTEHRSMRLVAVNVDSIAQEIRAVQLGVGDGSQMTVPHHKNTQNAPVWHESPNYIFGVDEVVGGVRENG